MKSVFNLLDYVFYRIYSWFKAKGDNIPEVKGYLILALMQIFTVFDLMAIVRIICEYPLPGKAVLAPLIFLVMILNGLRYGRDFDIQSLVGTWQNESEKSKVKNGWLISLYLIISLLIPATYGYLKYNIKAI
jgi:hypothetical protein